MDGRENREPLVEIRGIRKLFDQTQGIVDTVLGREPQPVRAVDGVSFDIEQGDVVGIAGESGCGKTTIGKMLVGLHQPTEGEIYFDGQDITDMSNEEEREFRKRVQMIFQDPFESLNPRMTVYDTVAEPLKINNIEPEYEDRRDRVRDVLEDVGLAPADVYLDAFPDELSGGERQRVAIARALVVDPDFVVCDEPVSMLDVSIRAGVLNLMQDLKEEYGLTYLFISHDLSLIRYMCERVGVMYLGNMVEQGPTNDVVNDPKHPYTEALFDAVPDVEMRDERRRANATGEVPSPRNPPSGCRYHPRCANIIPPEDWDGSQEAFRRAYQFRLRIEREEIGQTTIDPSEADSERELLEHGLTLNIPDEYQSDTERDTSGTRVDLGEIEFGSGVQGVLEDAAAALQSGDKERALSLLEDDVRTICAEDTPEPQQVENRDVACHLYDDRTPSTDLSGGVGAAATDD
ncbi:MAG: ABC transporter ATP-binding protein [Halobaculum sp.]